MREHYYQEIARLQSETLTLGHLVAGAITESVLLLERGDQPGAARLVKWDDQVNARQAEIESDTLALIATQGPVAGDMRLLAAVLDIADELERIGDYAKGIAHITERRDPEPYSAEIMAVLRQMAELSRAMLQDAMEAFARHDVAAARRIIRRDDEVDAGFNQVFEYVVRGGAADSRAMERANYLLWVAHNLERTADRVTNICERVMFMAGETAMGSGQWSVASSQ